MTQVSESAMDGRKAKGLRIFLRKGILALACLLAPICLVGQSVHYLFPWKDPRKRILWDVPAPDTSIYLLGDSIFTSPNVNESSQTLWNRLQYYSNITVFPAALGGAGDQDIVNSIYKLRRYMTSTSIVLIDINPNHFASDYNGLSGANYPYLYRQIIPNNFFNSDGINDFLIYAWLLPMPIMSFTDFGNHLKRQQYYSQSDFIWNDENAWSYSSLDLEFTSSPRELSERRFISLQKYIVFSSAEHFELLLQTRRILSKKGIEPIFVLTPLNRSLINCFLSTEKALKMIEDFEKARARKVDFLVNSGMRYLDLTDKCPSDAFADLMHTNVKGDDIMAMEIAKMIKKN